MEKNKAGFEESVKALEEIVRKLENGDCSLEESIELYEKGMSISAECSKLLTEAHNKIITLSQAEELK